MRNICVTSTSAITSATISTTSLAAAAVLAAMSSDTVCALKLKRNEALPTKLDKRKNVHHSGRIALRGCCCQCAGFALACQISRIAWYGFHKLAIGMKYQPTAQPGENCMPVAPNCRALELAR